MTTISGTALDDLLRGSLTDDTIEGLDGNDQLEGGIGANTLVGGNGDDSLWSQGIDHADGGAGKDEFFSVQYDSTLAFNIDITVSNSSSNIGNGTSFSSIEVLAFYGGTNNDKLTGGAFTDYLEGNGGNDRITGGAGNDNLDGGTGNDVVLGGDGDDNIGREFALGFDTGLGSDIINGGAGTDYLILNREDTLVNLVLDISAGGGNTNIGDGSRISGIERIWFRGGEASNTVTGGALDDRLEGYVGNDTFNGGGGNDVLVGNIFGFGGSSSINKLSGDSGDDFIIVNGGIDLVDGGADFDTLSISRFNSEANLTIDISAGGGGTDIGDGSTIANFEQLFAIGGSGNDKIVGGASSDGIQGGGGTNTLAGGGGDDEIYAGSDVSGFGSFSSVDIVNGGAGTDFLNLDRSLYTGNITLDLSAGGGNVNIGDGSRISNIEQLVFVGGTGNDVVTGGNLDDVIEGYIGSNKLSGGAGNDKIVSYEVAVDVIDGGAGDDHLIMNRESTLVSLTIDLTVGGGGTDIGDGSKISSIESIEFLAGSGADKITGGAGDDNIHGGGGLNVLKGGGGDDMIVCESIDNIDGGSGNDTLVIDRTFVSGLSIDLSSGGGGLDIGDGTKIANVENLVFKGAFTGYKITGGVGDDSVDVDHNANALDGGAGTDFLRLNHAPSDIAIQLDISAGGGGLDIGNGTTVANFEQLAVFGSAKNDKLTGGALDDDFYGASGNDILNGGGGKDRLDGADGSDIIFSLDNQGPDILEGGFGSEIDTLILNRASQTKSLTINLAKDPFAFSNDIGDGTQIFNFERMNLVSGSGGDLITGGIGSDAIDGRAGNDTVYGSAGIDYLKGGAGTADVLSYTGNSTYTPTGLVIDLVAGKATTSLANDTDTFSGFEAYYGSVGSDTLIGDALANELYGGDGDDVIKGGAGGDKLSGGNGLNDTLSYEGSTLTVAVNLATGSALGGDAAGDSFSGFENLTGGSGSDVLLGDSKNNTFSGGAGTDAMWGGAGDDIYIVDQMFDSAIENPGEGIDLVRSSISEGLAPNVENLELTGVSNIIGIGNELDNILTGNAGSNTLDGRGGADIMTGKLGNDVYFVNDAGDVVTEAANEGIDTVRSSIDAALSANVEKLYLEFGAADGTGNGLSNFIYGNASANKLDGGAGADRLYGGEGGDTYTVDSVGDLVFETVAGAAGGADTVNASASHMLSANVENLNLTGAANISGTGNGEANTIVGNSGNNFINGGLANDTLTGGLGRDTFVFTTAFGASNADTVTDFTVADDTMRLDDAVFSALSLGYLSAGAFHIGSSAADTGDRIIYNSATGDLFYDADGAGGAAQVRFAILDTGLAMTSADIYVF
jgi:Ca2+-binding RTX toxin-like protein